MNKLLRLSVLLLTVAIMTSCQSTGSVKGPKVEAKSLYEMKFQEGMTEHPEDFFVMDGTFNIRKLGNNYAMHLYPRPLNTYGTLFGPELKSDLVVSADIFASKTGRTLPVFGIGSHGLTGFRLYLRPARNSMLIQIVYNETQVIASTEYPDWQNDTWTSMKMYVKVIGEDVEIYGKAWPQKQAEGKWLVSYKGKLEVDEGQCSFWGIPYSGRDIFFDNLKIDKP